MESFSGQNTCDDTISLMAKGTCTCVMMYFEIFLDLICNTLNLGRYSSHKQKVFEVLDTI